MKIVNAVLIMPKSSYMICKTFDNSMIDLERIQIIIKYTHMIHTYFVVTQSLDPIHDRQINMIHTYFVVTQSGSNPPDFLACVNSTKHTNFYLLNKPEFHVISDIIINFII
jgi:hypothetical protein